MQDIQIYTRFGILLNRNMYLCGSHWDRCLGMPHTPVPVTASSDRFDQLMEKSEERRGSIDFSREIAEARAILSKANF
jgi:hypothetical protein